IRLLPQQGVREFLQASQLSGAIELPRRSGGLDVQAEAQRTGAIVGRRQQVIELAQRGNTGVALDDAATPVVRACIAQRAEQTVHAQSVEGAVFERQLQRI